MTSLREVVESARASLPKALFARWAAVLFSLSILTFVISLAASEAFLFTAALCYAIDRLRAAAANTGATAGPSNILRFPFPPVRLPVACFCLFTILSVFGAANSYAGAPAARQLTLFLVMLLAVALTGAPALRMLLLDGLFFASALASVVSAFQFVIEYKAVRAAHPGHVYAIMSSTRIHGFMGHWMNFGGQQMLVFCLMLAYLLFAGAAKPGQNRGPEPEARPSGGADGHSRESGNPPRRCGELRCLALGLIALSILLNFTRGVWLGCFVAVVYLVWRWKPRWLLVLPVLIGLAFAAGPKLLRERLDSLLHPTRDPSISIRLEMWQVALRMIRAHPWLGVGPGSIERDYALYLPAGKSPEVGYHEHLHDNVLQIGAERGLPCLAAWLWMMVGLLGGLIGLRRGSRGSASVPSAGVPAIPKPPPWIVEGAIAAWLAFVVEGIFEYNFGTSPVLMVFLFVMSVSFARSGFPLSRE